MRVIVAGGGWAGLAAAVELTRAGIPVTVLEAARQLGGRARAVRFGDLRVDNGQHLLLGAYTGLLELLTTLKVPAQQVLLRRPLHLQMRSPDRRTMQLRAPRLPAPLHLLAGLLTLRGIAMRDKLRAISGWDKLLSFETDADQDISVSELLQQHGQPASIQTQLWRPLCLAAMNTAPDEASARVFVRVLNEAFTGQRQRSDLLFARSDLGKVLPQPACDYIEHHGGRVLLGHKLTGLICDSERVSGVRTDQGLLEADHVILAMAHGTTARMLSAHPAFDDIVSKLARIETRPIITVYLRYPPRTRLGGEMIGLIDATAQWVFDQAMCGRPGVMAAVISGDGAHMDLDNDALTARVQTDLHRLRHRWPAPLETLVVREKRATFACQVGIESLRPGHVTPLSGCWLAGDYTATGLPATLEGAVRSGQLAARAIIAGQQDLII